jgi:hypothetical protein
MRGRGAGGWDGPGRVKGTWENNDNEYLRVRYGAGSRGTAIENTKKSEMGGRGIGLV